MKKFERVCTWKEHEANRDRPGWSAVQIFREVPDDYPQEKIDQELLEDCYCDACKEAALQWEEDTRLRNEEIKNAVIADRQAVLRDILDGKGSDSDRQMLAAFLADMMSKDTRFKGSGPRP